MSTIYYFEQTWQQFIIYDYVTIEVLQVSLMQQCRGLSGLTEKNTVEDNLNKLLNDVRSLKW